MERQSFFSFVLFCFVFVCLPYCFVFFSFVGHCRDDGKDMRRQGGGCNWGS